MGEGREERESGYERSRTVNAGWMRHWSMGRIGRSTVPWVQIPLVLTETKISRKNAWLLERWKISNSKLIVPLRLNIEERLCIRLWFLSDNSITVFLSLSIIFLISYGSSFRLLTFNYLTTQLSKSCARFCPRNALIPQTFADTTSKCTMLLQQSR